MIARLEVQTLNMISVDEGAAPQVIDAELKEIVEATETQEAEVARFSDLVDGIDEAVPAELQKELEGLTMCKGSRLYDGAVYIKSS